MDDGERMEMGEVTFEILHTHSHTSEHISVLSSWIVRAALARRRCGTAGLAWWM